MQTVTITVRAPDVKDIQPQVAEIIRELWIGSLTVDYQRVADDAISVSDRALTWLVLSNTDPYITLSATR